MNEEYEVTIGDESPPTRPKRPDLDWLLGAKVHVTLPYQPNPNSNIPTPPTDGIYDMVFLGCSHIIEDGADGKKPWQAIDIVMDFCCGSSKGYYTYAYRQQETRSYMGRYRVFLGHGNPVDEVLEKIKKSNGYDKMEQIEIGKSKIKAEIKKTKYGIAIINILDSPILVRDNTEYDYITIDDYSSIDENKVSVYSVVTDIINKNQTSSKNIYGNLLKDKKE